MICVGNFTAGGTGKTPFAQMLAETLAGHGAHPAMVSRGYGGSARGAHWVDATGDPAALVGDEPLLLARTAPVLVARDRAAGARVIEADPRAFTHIIMDDGLQNPALAKTLAIALVDGARGFGNGGVIPAGPLRAPLDVQMSRVDAIVVNGGSTDPAEATALATTLSRTFAGPVLEARIRPSFDASTVAGRDAIAFAGIGAPQRFFDLLRALEIIRHADHVFGDHHAFTEAEAEMLLAQAKRHDAVLLTTEKDLARLSGTTGARAALRAQARAVPIRLTVVARDQHRLDALLAPLL